MLSKILRLSVLLLATVTFMANAHASTSDSPASVQKTDLSASSKENTNTIKSFAEKIKQAVIAGNNKINAGISKLSNIVKQALNKNKDSDVSKQVAQPEKAKLSDIPKKFVKNNINYTVQSIAARLKAAISSGDYNLMASIIRTTPADLLQSAISSAVSDDHLISIPLAKSVSQTLPKDKSDAIVNNIATQLAKSDHNETAEQVSKIGIGGNNQTASDNQTPLSGYQRDLNDRPIPTIEPARENPSIASKHLQLI